MLFLSFAPQWICRVTGKLSLANNKTGETYSYDLLGVGDEPLAEDIISIDCKARHTTEYVLNVPNFDRRASVSYSVESDLPYLSGDSSISVASGKTSPYTIKVQPQVGGQYSGSITFRDSSGRFVWYAIEINATAPEPETTLKVKAFVRSAVCVEVTIANPLNEVVEFAVAFAGDCLFGEPSFSLQPLETKAYQFVYSPLVSGVYEGAVTFSNTEGEFWYKLALTAESSPPEVLKPLECALGCEAISVITLDNPTEETIILRGKFDPSSSSCFSLSSSSVQLAPFSSSDLDVIFSPSSIGDKHVGTLRFSHPKVGEWVYSLEGLGLPPGLMPVSSVSSHINTQASSMVSFKNPLENSCSIKVSLITNDPSIAKFELFLRRSQVTLASKAVLQIPFTYLPFSMVEAEATIIVENTSSSPSLTWKFPIRGIADAPPSQLYVCLNCKARENLHRKLILPLIGLSPLKERRLNEFRFEVPAPSEYSVFLNRSLAITMVQDPEKASIFEQSAEPDASVDAHKLGFEIFFEPLRPVHINTEIIIIRESGGRWRFPFKIDVDDPDVDDTIRIEAPINRTSSVAFSLSSEFGKDESFTAFLSSGSSSAFAVTPKSGIMHPRGQAGTQITISFSPDAYGKKHTGRLIVLTADMQWSYDLIGAYPAYKAPEMASHKLRSEIVNKQKLQKAVSEQEAKRRNRRF